LGVSVLLASSAGAQVSEKKVLSAAGARKVAAAAVAEAKKRQARGGAIAVVDDGGHLLLLVRLDGTFGAAANVAQRKARTAATFRRATRDFENAVAGGRASLVAVPEMTPLQGGVPILADGQTVGAIGVSGAASAQQDDDIATAAAAAFSANGPGDAFPPAEGPALGAAGLTLDGAMRVAAAAAAEAKKTGSAGAIAVVDDGGYLLYAERLEGTFTVALAVSARKAKTAATFRRPTRDFEEAVKAGRTSLAAMPDDMTPLQGGVPILVGGRVVGAVGVSGAVSAQADEEMATAGASALR
jgi:glc operon protein GlcG